MEKSNNSTSTNLSNINTSRKGISRRAAIGKMLGLTAGSLVAVSFGPYILKKTVYKIRIPKRYQRIVKAVRSVVLPRKRRRFAKK